MAAESSARAVGEPGVGVSFRQLTGIFILFPTSASRRRNFPPRPCSQSPYRPPPGDMGTRGASDPDWFGTPPPGLAPSLAPPKLSSSGIMAKSGVPSPPRQCIIPVTMNSAIARRDMPVRVWYRRQTTHTSADPRRGHQSGGSSWSLLSRHIPTPLR